MMPTSANDAALSPSTTLPSSYKLPIAVIALAIPLFFLQEWVAAAIALFGIFLLVQAATLHLVFTPTDLDVYRGETLIRRFPYLAWRHWEIYFPVVPILFYFREVQSIHFLPVLFDANLLRACLEQHCPNADVQPRA